MKTKDDLIKTALSSKEGFKLVVVDLLADIRNLIIIKILSQNLEVFDPDLYDKALSEMKRVITEEDKNK